jgi:hypothetical protein
MASCGPALRSRFVEILDVAGYARFAFEAALSGFNVAAALI